jgi:hypothetical protein
MFKVIIAGGRDFKDYEKLEKFCNVILKNKKEIQIVCGCASGADELGKKYAFEKNYKIIYFPANWKEFPRSAGIVRNKEMADYADALIAFWDGKSKGTENMIDQAKKNNLKIRIIKY